MRNFLICLLATLLGNSAIAGEKAQCNSQQILDILLKNPRTSERLKSILSETIAQNPGKSKRKIIGIFLKKKRLFRESLQKQAETFVNMRCGRRGSELATPPRTEPEHSQSLDPSGSFDTPWTGLALRDASDAEKASETIARGSAIVAKVVAGAPASLAGMREGDVITEMNGKRVADAADCRKHIIQLTPGSIIPLKFSRAGAEHETKLIVSSPALFKRSVGMVRLVDGHRLPISSIAVSRDGHLLATGSHDKTVRLWELGSGRLITTLEGHSGAIWSVALSPDDKWVLSASEDQTIKVWDAATGRLARTLVGHGDRVWSVSPSPDSMFALSGSSDHKMILWEIATGRQLKEFEGHTDAVRAVAFSPDGRSAVSASDDNTIRIWDVATGANKRVIQCGGGPRSIAFSPDGKSLVLGSNDGSLKIISEEGSSSLTLGRHGAPVSSAVFSSNGNLILSGSDDATVKLWDVKSATQIRSFDANSSGVSTVAFTPDGSLALSAGWDAFPDRDGSWTFPVTEWSLSKESFTASAKEASNGDALLVAYLRSVGHSLDGISGAPKVGQDAAVIVAFSLDRSGNLKSLSIYDSSGFPELDRFALSAVSRMTFPKAPMNTHQDVFKFRQKIVFHSK